jgi:hypothetical protein
LLTLARLPASWRFGSLIPLSGVREVGEVREEKARSGQSKSPGTGVVEMRKRTISIHLRQI